jgi:hypothetical protein
MGRLLIGACAGAALLLAGAARPMASLGLDVRAGEAMHHFAPRAR